MMNFKDYQKYKNASILSEDIQKKAFFVQIMPRAGWDPAEIREITSKHVVEIFFRRRIWPVKNATYQKMPSRRMLCTANWGLVKRNSALFKWKPPQGKIKRGKKWYEDRKLVIVWDLLLKNWRMISLDDFDIINVYPIMNKKDEMFFIEYYKNLVKRRGSQRLIQNVNN